MTAIRIPLTHSAQAALARIARRIGEGFEGKITVDVRRGGVASLQWLVIEDGNMIKEEEIPG